MKPIPFYSLINARRETETNFLCNRLKVHKFRSKAAFDIGIK